jgi:uncharacterized paraquat-inducible protein A
MSSMNEPAARTTQRFCISCGGDRRVDIETSRCTVCGKPTARGEALEQLQAQAAARAAMVLPGTPTSRRWIEQTRALAENFRTAAAAAEARAKAAAAEADQLGRAARAFEGLLAQVVLPDAPQKALPRPRLGSAWSRKFDACVSCGTTVVPHKARGLCNNCEQREQREQRQKRGQSPG